MTALDILDELLARDVVTDQTRKYDNHRMCAAQLGLHFHTQRMGAIWSRKIAIRLITFC